MEVRGYQQLFGYQHLFFKYFPLCLTKKETHTSLEQLEDEEMMTDFFSFKGLFD